MKQELDVKVENEVLSIIIGAEVLGFAFEGSDYNNPFNHELDSWVRDVKVIDHVEFTKDVMEIMMKEEEDGSCPLTNFLDEMCKKSVDYGNMGIEYPEDLI